MTRLGRTRLGSAGTDVAGLGSTVKCTTGFASLQFISAGMDYDGLAGVGFDGLRSAR